jgi:hypothetical protein
MLMIQKLFCEASLDGLYAIAGAKSGNEIEAGVNQVTITGKNAAGVKLTMSFYTKGTLSETEIMDALIGKTFNKVKFNNVSVIDFSKVKIG